MKRRQRAIRVIGALLVILAALLVWDGRLVAMIRFTGNAHAPSLNSDYTRLDSVLPGGTPVIAEVYRGLPHPFYERDEFVHDLWLSSNRSIHGYRFRNAPETLSREVKAAFTATLSRKDSYSTYGGPKMCGGYHADFAIKMADGGRSCWLLVCLGCGEVLIYAQDGKDLICDLDQAAELELLDAARFHLGNPFDWVSTRLPIAREALASWGYSDGGVRFGRQEKENAERFGPAAIRTQTIKSVERDPVKGYFRFVFVLREETYASSDAADRRAKELEIVADPLEPYGAGAGVVQGGFAIGPRAYLVTTNLRGQMAGAPHVVESLRRYCEESAERQVKKFR